MTASSNGIDFLLEILSIQELNEIKNDLELFERGYQLAYAVDTYDIVNYSLPFFDDNYFKDIKKSVDYYKIIAYENVFSDKSDFNFCLLDEYKIELISIKNKIQKRFENFNATQKKLLDTINKTAGNLNDKKNINKVSKLIKTNLDFIIASMIFIDHGSNIYDRFFSFLEDKINTFEYVSKDEEVDAKINEIFADTKQSELTRYLYDNFVDEITGQLLSLESTLQRYIYLENSFRDIIVIDRTLNINLKLQTSGIKHVFLYLSSAPTKSDIFFEILRKKKNTLPTIEGIENFNFHRNIFQLFLFNFFLEALGTNRAFVFSFIKELIELKTEKVFVENTTESLENKRKVNISESHQKILKLLEDILKSNSLNIENSILYSVYQNYNTKIEETLKNMNKADESSAFRLLLSNIAKTINKGGVFRDNLGAALTSLGKMRQTYQLSNKLKHLNKEQLSTFIPIGRDVVKNNFHHLPYLLFLNNPKSELKNSLYNLFDSITNNPSETDQLTKRFNDNIHAVLKVINSKRKPIFKDEVNEFLTLLFLNLISPPSNPIIRENSEEEICNILLDRKSLVERSNISFKIEEKKGRSFLKAKIDDSSIIQEIDYFIIWLFRRTQQFERALSLCNKYIHTTEITDPRFYHGRGLVYCSMGYDMILRSDQDSQSIIDYLRLSISDLSLAVSGYKPLIQDKNEHVLAYKALIKKNIIAITNSILDSKIRIIELSQEKELSFEYLKEARALLIEIKEIGLSVGIDKDNYNKYPTLNHTETELEYYESLLFYKNDQLNEAKNKIVEAAFRSYNFIDQHSLIPGNFSKITHSIKDLRYKIFESLGLFS